MKPLAQSLLSPGDQLEPGSHICLLYSTEEEHQAALVQFFRQGIERGARILYAMHSHTAGELRVCLAQAGIELEALIERGQVSLLDARELYQPDGIFSTDHLLSRFAGLVDQAITAGYPAIYLSAEMAWVQPSTPLEALAEFESQFNYLVMPVPMLVVCQYDRRSFPPAALIDTLMTHPLVMIADEVYDNHLFIPPAVYNRHATGESRLDYLLNVLLDRQQIEKRLRRSEQMYESITNASPDGIILITPDDYIRYASPKALAVFGYQRLEEVFGSSIWEYIAPEEQARGRDNLINSILREPTGDKHYAMIRKDGARFIGEIDAAPFFNENGDLEGVVGVVRDVTGRVRTEQALREHQARLDLIFSQVPVNIWTTDASLTITSLLGGQNVDTQERGVREIGRQLDQPGNGINPAIIAAHHQALLGSPQELQTELWGRALSMRLLPLRDEDGQIIGVVGAGLDITDQKAAREALYNSEQSANAMLSALRDVAILFDMQGAILAINEPGAAVLQRQSAELVGHSIFEVLNGPFVDKMRQWMSSIQTSGDPYHEVYEQPDGFFELTIQPVRDSHGQVVRMALVSRDVTLYMQAQQQERERRVAAETLRASSEALTQAITEEQVYDSVLDHIRRLLPDVLAYLLLSSGGSDGALRFYPLTTIDRHLHGRRRPTLYIHTTAGLKQMNATRQPLIISTIDEFPGWVRIEEPIWTQSFAGIPIIVDNMVAGFICLHSNQIGYFQPNHIEILNNFASQMTISLQKAQAFTALSAAYSELGDKNAALAAAYYALEEKNQALAAAYNATIEGWSRALELRDKETQGHSQRVVALTVRLAQCMGVPESEILYIRWGALLHDIGKMGIPDNILLKKDPLNEEDWRIMKQHPTLAYRWLAGIDYLKPALDIPYYHHEHWDGNGYPHGLSGELIPLPARIFAVIDAWDALLADRPYRLAWPRAAVIRHLREQSGQKFDPQVVEVFLKMIDANE